MMLYFKRQALCNPFKSTCGLVHISMHANCSEVWNSAFKQIPSNVRDLSDNVDCGHLDCDADVMLGYQCF
jgi:hypothetical protein